MDHIACGMSMDSVWDGGEGGRGRPAWGRRGKQRPSFLELLIHLWPGDWREHLSKLNTEIERENSEQVSCLLPCFSFSSFHCLLLTHVPISPSLSCPMQRKRKAYCIGKEVC